MNIRDRRNMHHAAGQALANARGDLKQIVLIYLGIISILSLAASGISVLLSDRIENTGGLSNMGLRSMLSTLQTLLPIVQTLVLLGLEIGYCDVAMRVYRKETVTRDTLFGGFRRFFPFLRTVMLQGFLYAGVCLISLYLSVYIFLMLPSSAAFQELMTPMIASASALSGTITLDEATMLAATDAIMPAVWIFAVLFLLVFIPMYYRYRMVPYCLLDQSRPRALLAMHQSRTLMHRNRFALLKLDLSLWWFYALQVLAMAVCYGDVLLARLGIALPWSPTASYFVFLILSLMLQATIYYFFMNRVAVTYAVAYETLLQSLQERAGVKPAAPANVPWKDQY
ncbi:MAG: hypothetical protein IKT52_03155 [Oscillospiraceae bacterium]|nr:hypothetical protein [Oscillospiraceae bacterium]